MALIEKDFRVKKGIIVTEDATIGGNLTVTGSINADIVGNASTSSAWATPRTITLSGDVNGSVTIDGSSDVTITTTSSADSIELGTDTTGNYTSSVLQGSGIIVDGVIGEGSEFTVSHADTSSVIDLTSSGRTYVTSLIFDTFGHVTGYSTGTETILGTDLTYLTAETSGTITTSTGTTDAIIPAATQTLAGLMTNLDKIKLDSIESNSQVNQNAFSNISVNGQITVSADSPSDTLTLIAGTNISITTDSVNDTITINADDTFVDWSEIQNKPDPVITVTLEGDITGTANTTLTDLTSGTITLSTTISSNSVELGTDTTGNYMSEVTQGDGIIVSHTPGEGSSATISHADTSSQGSVDNTNGTVIQDIALDGFGHITSIGSVNLDSRYFTETESDSRFVLKSGDTMSGYLTLHSNPTNSLHAVTKQYVDEVAEGLETKPSVEIATIGNLDATYSNGVNGVGATLTANSNGAFPSIDGITLTSIVPGENGVLVKNEPNSARNGRYNLTQVGDASNPWVLTRCGLCDESNEIPGSYTFVKQGTSYKGTGWVQIVTNPSTFVVGTDAIIVTQFSGAGTYTAGLGLNLTGTKFSHADTSSINNLSATSRTYVTGLTFDDFGHVTDYSTGTETVINTNTTYSVKASTQTGGASLDLDAAGSGSGTDSVTFKGSGATTVTRTDADTITISSVNTVYTHPSHPGDDIDIDTGPLTGATVISDLDFNVTTDTLGHVTDANATIATRTLTPGDIGAAAVNANTTGSAGSLVSGARTITVDATGNWSSWQFRSNQTSASAIRILGSDGSWRGTFYADGTSQGFLNSSNAWVVRFNNGTLETGTVPWARLSGVPSTLSGTVNTSGDQTIGGTKTFSSVPIISATSGTMTFADSGTTKRGIMGTVGGSDQWFFGGGATASNAGFLEIATGDDNGTEPIHVRQYQGGSPLTGTITRTLTLLDGSGNTSFPGAVTATGFSGSGASLTSLNGTNITTGTVADARIASTLVRTSRSISSGSGLTGGGNLTADRTFAVDGTVVRTSSDQTIDGIKTFNAGRINSPGSSSHDHGSISIGGQKGTYAGIAFPDANAVFMVRASDALSGVYVNNNTWRWYFDGSGNLTIGTVPWARLSGVPSTLSGTVNTSGSQSISGIKTFNQGTNSTSTITGSIILSGNGGIGVGGNVNIGGALTATSKSFLIDHPTKPGQKLQYGSLESPYHGVRLTGEGIISKNSVTIDLPDYIHGLCKQEGAQVQITNIKHGKVIWVEEIDIDNDKFTVALDRRLFDTKEYRFYWSFTAVRKDIEDMIVEINSDL